MQRGSETQTHLLCSVWSSLARALMIGESVSEEGWEGLYPMPSYP
jgi:hypothetical protein